MPDDDNRDSTERLLDQLREVMEAPEELTDEERRDKKSCRLDMLVRFVFANAGYTLKRYRRLTEMIKDLRARFPFPPWLIKTVGSIGIVGVIAAGGWLIHLNACVFDNAKKIDKNEDRLRITENGIVRLSADMDNLLKSNDVPQSGPSDWRRARKRLDISTDSLAKLPTRSPASDTAGQ